MLLQKIKIIFEDLLGNGFLNLIKLKINYLLINLAFLLLALLSKSCTTNSNDFVDNAECEEPVIVEKIEVDSVRAANGVGFDLKTVGDKQFVAYCGGLFLLPHTTHFISDEKHT